MFTKIFIYNRVSDPSQVGGTGLQGQLRDLEALVAYEFPNDPPPTIVLRDEGLSGYHGDHRSRGVLGRFEAEALAGEHQGALFLCEKVDRLSREGARKGMELVQTLTDNGVSVRTLDGERFNAGEDVELVQDITARLKFDLARRESKHKADRTARNWGIKREFAKATKTALTKLVDPWIIVDDDRTMRLHEGRAALVLRWFEMADAGAGAKTIADMMDREGEPTWDRFANRSPKRWNRTFIAATLRNRAVIGEFTPKVNGVPQEPWIDHFPACVPADLFARVNNAAPIRKAASTGLRSQKVVNLVSGLASCSHCGSRLRYSKGRSAGTRWTNPQGKTYSYRRDCGSLICPLGEARKCANRRYLAYLTFEDALLDACLHLALDDDAFANRGEVSRLNVTIAERTRAHDLALESFKNLTLAWAEKPTELRKSMADEAEAKVEQLATNLAALHDQREAARGRADSAAHLRRVADVRAALYHPDLAQRVPVRKKVKQALAALVEKITYDGEKVIVIFVAGAAVLQFDRKGHLRRVLDFVKDGRAVQPVLADYARRRRDAKERGAVFSSRVPDALDFRKAG